MDGNKKHFRQHDGRQRAKFNAYGQPLSIKKALYRLAHELDLLHASPLDARKVTTNVELRRDGEPRGDACMPADPGVAAYFKLHDKERVLACDKWDEIADNIAAVAAHIDALRRQDRYGVGTIDQVFAGYAALPPPGRASRPARPWYEVLGVDRFASLEEAEYEYRRRAKVAHPDNLDPVLVGYPHRCSAAAMGNIKRATICRYRLGR